MTKLIQAMCRLVGYRYALQPGDGTCYEFTLIDLVSAWVPAGVAEKETFGIRQVISGVGDGENFCILIIHSPGQGSCECSITGLKNYNIEHHLAYIHSKMSGIDNRLDLHKILAAASVLIESPKDLVSAIEAMTGVEPTNTPADQDR